MLTEKIGGINIGPHDSEIFFVRLFRDGFANVDSNIVDKDIEPGEMVKDKRDESFPSFFHGDVTLYSRHSRIVDGGYSSVEFLE